jgi:WD40 repeat protein
VPSTPIRSIDFLNRDYSECGHPPVPVRNGEWVADPTNPTDEGIGSMTVQYADVTGDGADDAIVAYDCYGGLSANNWYFVAFTMKADQVVQIGTFDGITPTVVNGSIQATVEFPLPDDPRCCPSREEVVTYSFNGTALAETARQLQLSDLSNGTVSVASGRILFPLPPGSGRLRLGIIDSAGEHELTLGQGPAGAHVRNPVLSAPDHVLFNTLGTAADNGYEQIFDFSLKDFTIAQLTHNSSFGNEISDAQDGVALWDMWTEDIDAVSLQIGTPGAADARELLHTETGPTAQGRQPAFSPDGKSVVFTNGAIFVIGADGNGVRQIADSFVGAGHPRWSPDGSTILFSSSLVPDGPAILMQVPAAGGASTPFYIPPGGASATDAVWSPDGTQVLYRYDQSTSKHSELHLIDVASKTDRLLFVLPDFLSKADESGLDWAP